MSFVASEIAAAADNHGAYNPIAPAGIIVQVGRSKIDIGCAEALRGLLSYRVLTSAHCFIGAELAADIAVAVTTIAALPAIISRVSAAPCNLERVRLCSPSCI